MAQFFDIPAADLENFLRSLKFERSTHGTEVVYTRLARRNQNVMMKVYTSITEGDKSARSVGSDAIRVCVVFSNGSKSFGIGKFKPVFRVTSTESILTRLRERIMEAAVRADEWITADAVRQQKWDAERKAKQSPKPIIQKFHPVPEFHDAEEIGMFTEDVQEGRISISPAEYSALLADPCSFLRQSNPLAETRETKASLVSLYFWSMTIHDCTLIFTSKDGTMRKGPVVAFIIDNEEYYKEIKKHLKKCDSCDPNEVLQRFLDRREKTKQGLVSGLLVGMADYYLKNFRNVDPSLVKQFHKRRQEVSQAANDDTLTFEEFCENMYLIFERRGTPTDFSVRLRRHDKFVRAAIRIYNNNPSLRPTDSEFKKLLIVYEVLSSLGARQMFFRKAIGRKEPHSRDGKSYIVQTPEEKWKVYWKGSLVGLPEGFRTRELARITIRTLKQADQLPR